MYRKILVPIDGSPTAQRGFEEALGLARVMGATLLLVNVMDPYPVSVEWASASTWQLIADGMRQHGRSLIDRARSTAIDVGVAAETKLMESSAGRVADALIELVREAGCDLIVMGTHGRRGFNHLVMGSDAERVVRESPVPVLLVRHPDTQPG